MKYSFRNDYSEIACDEILNALVSAKNEQNDGYGLDKHSDNAKKLISEAFSLTNSDIHFVTGGTQANMVALTCDIKHYEAIICCDTGHINVHETGAVDGAGYKILTCPNVNGKLTLDGIKDIMALHGDCHMVKPKIVYITDSTEIGTIYTKKELVEISNYCKENDLYLFLDGARLASGLTAKNNDITPADLGKYCDMFTIGGTKIGMMYGEAIVINNDKLKDSFRYHIKNKGAMLAKGFVVGIEYEAAFTNNLYFNLGKKENELAYYLAEGIEKAGYKLYEKATTNQIFVVINKKEEELLKPLYGFENWGIIDSDHIAIRFVVSWFTKKESIDMLLDDLKKIKC